MLSTRFVRFRLQIRLDFRPMVGKKPFHDVALQDPHLDQYLAQGADFASLNVHELHQLVKFQVSKTDGGFPKTQIEVALGIEGIENLGKSHPALAQGNLSEGRTAGMLQIQCLQYLLLAD